jgi:hypothetical protein
LDDTVTKALDLRFDVLRRANVPLAPVPEGAVAIEVEEIRRHVLEPGLIATRTLDASDKDRDVVIDWLKNLPVPLDERVLVLWPHYRAGIQVAYGVFSDYYDDLWFPSADDLWVVGSMRSWLLQLDHEESFAYFEHVSRPSH